MKEIQGKIKIGVISVDAKYPEYKVSVSNNLYFGFNGNYPISFEPALPDTCDVLCKFSEMTEEQCAELVEGYGIGWRNYLAKSQYEECLKRTAKESLISLLKANNCWTNEMIREYNKGNNFRDDPSPLEGTGIAPDDFLIIKLDQ
jgi:hypothetical protein